MPCLTNTQQLVVCTSKAAVATHLNATILEIAADAIAARGAFTVALSGGSLATFLSTLQEQAAATAASADEPLPQFDRWHVILADERCVPVEDGDSNLGALQTAFLSKVDDIPAAQVHGIDQSLLLASGTAGANATASVAAAYEETVRKVVALSGGSLDLAVLGFGPDGHTCSLFPGHPLLEEPTKWVAGIEDSPKPPPRRVTLTLPFLNGHTRNVVFCGAGSSKGPVLQKVLAALGPPVEEDAKGSTTTARIHPMTVADPPPYPCAMVRPDTSADANDDDSSTNNNRLIWIVDEDAMKGVDVAGAL